MREGNGSRPLLRAALYSGLCVRYDAISNSLRHKLDAFDVWRRAGASVECVAFVHASDYQDPRIRCVDSVAQLLRAEEFRTADVHIFEFGIHYPLFDAVFLVPETVPTIAIYHNVTPPDLADSPESRAALERSLIQRHNLSRMTWVASDSEYSRQQLLAFGLSPACLQVVPLPPANPLRISQGRQIERGDRVEILYVGRFVRAKAVLELLEAVSVLSRRVGGTFRLTMAGNPSLSSPAVLDEMEAWCAADRLGVVRLVPTPDDETLAALYAGADVFVMPSYHEGYCVPVVEALAAGCHVVAYDSSNLPSILGGLGTLVPTGDVQALAAALEKHVGRLQTARSRGQPVIVPTEVGEMEEGVWRNRVAAHLEQHSLPAFEAAFASLLRAALPELADAIPKGSVGHTAAVQSY